MFWSTCKAGGGGQPSQPRCTAAADVNSDTPLPQPETLSRSSSRGYPDLGLDPRSTLELVTTAANTGPKPGIAAARTRPRPRRGAGGTGDEICDNPGVQALGSPASRQHRSPASRQHLSPASGSPASPSRRDEYSREPRTRGPQISGLEVSGGEDGSEDDEALAERVWTFAGVCSALPAGHSIAHDESNTPSVQRGACGLGTLAISGRHGIPPQRREDDLLDAYGGVGSDGLFSPGGSSSRLS